MFGLTGRDAVLFDAAVAQKYPREDTTIVIPSLRVYGSFEENGKTVVICDLHYDFYWDYTQENWAWNTGGMTSFARAELETQNGAEVCTGFEILPDGEGTSYWIHDNCGPLAAQNADGNWVLPEAGRRVVPGGRKFAPDISGSAGTIRAEEIEHWNVLQNGLHSRPVLRVGSFFAFMETQNYA